MSFDLKELLCNRLWSYNPLAYGGVVFHEDGTGFVSSSPRLTPNAPDTQKKMGVANLLHAKFTWREVPSTPQAEEQAQQDVATMTTSHFKIEVTLLKAEQGPGSAAFVHETMYNDRVFDQRTFEISLEQGRWELKQPETSVISNKLTPYGRRLTFEPSILPAAVNFKKGEPRRLLGLHRFDEWKSFYSEKLKD
ncbi:hypothetical protein PpBr36_03287 [Pyricularia pennisetigena]|uniref:hypothetical protein n=1 Tax=Pyricularia pennisetigena TaxID=1578925 RepID=UPI00114EEE13|nr:hypothetical protein PpBr36_03287 [Pyricularia pennisetigena]TLS30982.1 hypothetical protein PpBr36_03287 [Pyricularia pennisetigena]